MAAAFKLAYSLAVAILLVLFVVVGTRTFYEQPEYPEQRFGYSPGAYEAYEEERADYHQNVFIMASVLGAVAAAAGLCLYRRVEAMPLGLVLGSVGIVIFGWAQAAEDFDRIGMTPLFVVVGIALGVVLIAGYWFLGARGAPAGNGG